jgi:hypothetical protein
MRVLFLFLMAWRRHNQKRGTGVNLAPLFVRRQEAALRTTS